MRAGVPVVAADTGAVAETAGEAAVLVAPGSPSTVAAAVHTVLSDPGLTSRLRAAGSARVQAFSRQRGAARLAEAVDKLRTRLDGDTAGGSTDHDGSVRTGEGSTW
jgi:glycosyltransferase involved in cell wall biosynthesis